MSHFLTNYFEVEQFIYRSIGVGQKVGVGGKLLRWTERGSFRRQLEYVGVSLQNWKAKHIVIHCIFSASIHIFQLFLFFFAPKSGLSSTVTKVSVCGSGGCFCFAFCPHTHLKRRDVHMILSSYAPDISAVWTHGHVGQFPGGLTSIVAPCYSMCVGYGMFLMFKHWFCWKYQHNKYMFNFIDHLHFYTCKWLWAPGHWFSWGLIMLLRRPCLIYIYV